MSQEESDHLDTYLDVPHQTEEAATCHCQHRQTLTHLYSYRSLSLLTTFLVAIVTVIILVPPSDGQQAFSPWRPPWDRWDPSVVVRTYYGDVRGFSIPWHIDDEIWNPEWEEQPPWYVRRINCFLGIPYALPPLGRFRFQVSFQH